AGWRARGRAQCGTPRPPDSSDGLRPSATAFSLWPPSPTRRSRNARFLHARSLLAEGHDEHSVDLVASRLVLHAVADPPHTPEAPLEERRRVVEEHLLDPDVDLGPLLLVQRGAAGHDQLVQLLVAVVAERLAALEDVEH